MVVGRFANRSKEFSEILHAGALNMSKEHIKFSEKLSLRNFKKLFLWGVKHMFLQIICFKSKMEELENKDTHQHFNTCSSLIR